MHLWVTPTPSTQKLYPKIIGRNINNKNEDTFKKAARITWISSIAEVTLTLQKTKRQRKFWGSYRFVFFQRLKDSKYQKKKKNRLAASLLKTMPFGHWDSRFMATKWDRNVGGFWCSLSFSQIFNYNWYVLLRSQRKLLCLCHLHL